MGLDIYYYAKAERLDPQPDEVTDALWEDEMLTYAHAGEGFAATLRGLEPGWYRVDGNPGEFRAGSYGGYNDFREALSQVALGVDPPTVWANPERYIDEPFYELIHFTDCDGTVGPEAAAALAVDFANYREEVLAKWSGDDGAEGYYRTRYDFFSEAFKTAAKGGLVQFA